MAKEKNIEEIVFLTRDRNKTRKIKIRINDLSGECS